MYIYVGYAYINKEMSLTYVMSLICLELTMIGELHIDHASAHLWWIHCVTGYHRCGRYLVGHFDKCLILALQHEHICHTSKWYPQCDYVRFAGFVWNVPQVNDF